MSAVVLSGVISGTFSVWLDGKCVAKGLTESAARQVARNPAVHGAALFEALKDLVLRVDASELADGSSLDTLKAHAALNRVEPGEWL